MKKLFKNIGAFALSATFLFSSASCFMHTHTWGEWQQNQTEHWRKCTGFFCPDKDIEERGEHVGSPCEICGPAFKAVAFYTYDVFVGAGDQAHVSFVHEANGWFAEAAQEYNFVYEATNNWDNLNDEFLSEYDLVMFLDARPEETAQRDAFERFMDNGGAWIGFHFSAFALDNSAYEQNWDWYHDEFLGSGEYVSNTWEPTTAILQVEDYSHPAAEHLPDTFEATACEWYRWEHDLRENPDITIIASIHESSFPLGTGPKPHEIWHEGYYPVIWSNNNYNMLYMNMGHNRITYGDNSKDLSSTFSSEIQNQMLLDAMFGLTKK